MDPLEKALGRVQRRLLLLRWLHLLTQSLVWAGVAACAWLLLTRLFPVLGNPGWPSLAILGAAAVAASLIALWRRPSFVQAALEADQRLGLKERFTSSLELRGVNGPMIAELHDDARKHVERLNVGRDFPLRVPRAIRWAAAPAAAYLLAFFFLPEFDLFGHRERVAEARAEAQATQVKVDRLRAVARPIREAAEEASIDELADAAEGIERIAAELAEAQITDRQALARLTDLSTSVDETREELQSKNPFPNLNGDPSSLNKMQSVAQDLKNGEYGEAAKKLKEMAQEMQSAGASPSELAALKEDMDQLAKMLGGEDTLLGEALGEAAKSLSMNDLDSAMAALEQMNMSLEDMASVLEQMEALGQCQAALGECKSLMMGPGMKGYGTGNKLGNYQGTTFAEGPGGLGGPGRGRGNQIGDMPDTESAFDPTMLPGEMTKGKVLATIMQRTAPDEDAEATTDFTAEAITAVTQQAEQAMTKEDIPPGARDFVRQYFGTLEPEDRDRVDPQ